MDKPKDYSNDWKKINKERINILADKGTKDKIQKHISGTGESISRFICRAVQETIDHDIQSQGEN